MCNIISVSFSSILIQFAVKLLLYNLIFPQGSMKYFDSDSAEVVVMTTVGH